VKNKYMKKIGFVGTGTMGGFMALNLFRAGFEVTAYNRTPKRLESLRANGLKVSNQLADAVAGQELVITMLSDDKAIEEVACGPNGILEFIESPTVLVNMSTVAPETSINLHARAKSVGVVAVDAPVSGSSKAAENAQLVILAGGEEDVVEALRDVFGAMSKSVYYFGEAGSGSRAKLVINLVLSLTMHAISEALVLAEKFALDRATVLDMIQRTAIASPFLAMKAPLLQNGEFPPAFALNLMHKDLRIIMEQAQKTGTVLPTGAAAFQSYTSALNHGMGDLDLAAVFDELLAASGLSTQF
jgi:3-hydroxyisobutyrate dehydrogenase